MSNEKRKGKMTVEEAGRKGGEATSETHGEEFYSDIGKKGGKIGGPRVRELMRKEKSTKKSRLPELTILSLEGVPIFF